MYAFLTKKMKKICIYGKKSVFLQRKTAKKKKTMATIALQYNERNLLAQRTLGYILSLGIFKQMEVEPLSSAEKKTRKAIKEIEEGKGIVCHSFDEFLAAVK